MVAKSRHGVMSRSIRSEGFLQGIGDLVVDVLLLEHLLVRELDLAVKVLKSCGLAKAEELVVDEAILEVVKLVDVLHNCGDRHN